MKIRLKLQIPRLEAAVFERQLQLEFSEAIARAAADYLNATTALIPTWSGASLATFRPLASELGLPLSILPVAGFSRVQVGVGQGVAEVASENGRFSFTYATSLKHLVFNEFNNANISPDPGLRGTLRNPGPYGFTKAGRVAVEATLRRVRPPKILDAFRIIKVRV